MKAALFRLLILLGSGIFFGVAVVLFLLYHYAHPKNPSADLLLISPQTIEKTGAVTAIEWQGEALSNEQYQLLYTLFLSSQPLEKAPSSFQPTLQLQLKGEKGSLQLIEIDRALEVWRVGGYYFSRPGLKEELPR